MSFSGQQTFSVVSVDSPQALESVLALLLSGNTDAIRAAEQSLAPFLKKKQCIPALMLQIHQSGEPGIRQIALVLLKSKISKLWSRLSDEERKETQRVLLAVIEKDPVHLVRLAAANAAAAVAKYTVPANNWPELFPFMMSCYQHGDAAHQDTALRLFESLLSAIPHNMKPLIPQVMAVLSNALQNQSAHVRSTAIRCFDAFLEIIESESQLESVVSATPLLVQAAQFCLDNEEEDVLATAVDVLVQMTEAALPLMSRFLVDLVNFVLRIASQSGLEASTRERALDYIIFLSEKKPSMLYKNRLVEPILSTIMTLFTEDVDMSVRDVSEGEAEDRFGSDAFYSITTNVPNHQVFDAAAAMIAQFMGSNSAPQRRAGLFALGILADTCNARIRQHLNELVPRMVTLFKDNDLHVRENACFAIVQFAEFAHPDILEYHALVIPGLLELLSLDPSPSVQEKACMVLDAFVENMELDTVMLYLDSLMRQLFALVERGATPVRAVAISATASAAIASGEKFLPYAGPLLDYLEQIMIATDDKHLQVRARATECIGNIAVSIGMENFRPRLERVVQLALQGFDLRYSELNEYTYGFFCNLAELLKEDFAPFLSILVPLAVSACESSEGIVATRAEKNDAFGNAPKLNVLESTEAGHDGEEDEEGEDNGEEDGVFRYKIRTSVIEEKASALFLLGKVAYATKQFFLPYLDAASDAVLSMARFAHDRCRMNVPPALYSFVMALHDAAAKASPPNPELGELLGTMLRLYIPLILHMALDDDEREVVAKAVEALAAIASGIGASQFAPFLEDVSHALVTLLEKKAACQTVEFDETDEDDADFDLILTDAIGDCIIDLVKVFGASFMPTVQLLYRPLSKYWSKNRTEEDRSMALGVAAEIAANVGASCAQLVDPLLPVAVKGIQDESSLVQRNCAYMLGALCLNGSAALVTPHYPKILNALWPLLSQSTAAERVVLDNVVGAVARMIITAPTVPLDQVLPPFFALLPIQEDLEEMAPVVQAFEVLVSLSASPSALQQMVTPMLSSIAHVIVKKEASKAVLSRSAAFLRGLVARLGDAAIVTGSALAEEHRHALICLLQQEQTQ